MSKDILLLLAGGLIAFGFSLVLSRLNRREAKITWVGFPPVILEGGRLIAICFYVRNDGTGGASNLRVVLDGGDGCEVTSIEVSPSEVGLRSERIHSSNPGRIELHFPHFHSNVSCALTGLIRGPVGSKVDISILGDNNVVGRRVGGDLEETLRKRRRVDVVLAWSLGSLIVACLSLGFYIVASVALDGPFREQIAVGELYQKIGRHDLALIAFRGPVAFDLLGIKGMKRGYAMATAYAGMGRHAEAVRSLRLLSGNLKGARLAQAAAFDPAFDPIRTQPAFIEFLSSFQTSGDK